MASAAPPGGEQRQESDMAQSTAAENETFIKVSAYIETGENTSSSPNTSRRSVLQILKQNKPRFAIGVIICVTVISIVVITTATQGGQAEMKATATPPGTTSPPVMATAAPSGTSAPPAPEVVTTEAAVPTSPPSSADMTTPDINDGTCPLMGTIRCLGTEDPPACIHLSRVCDGVDDCENGEDEIECDREIDDSVTEGEQICPHGEIRCPDTQHSAGRCVPLEEGCW